MVQLHGIEPRATPPPSNFPPFDHDDDDDSDDNGYVSLDRNVAEYSQDRQDQDQSNERVDEETDAVPRVEANSSSRAGQLGSPLRKRRTGSRAPSAETDTPRATSHPPQQVALGPLPPSPVTSAAAVDASGGQSGHATPVLAPAPLSGPPSLPLPPLEPPFKREPLRHITVRVGRLRDYAMSVRPAVHNRLIAISFLFLVATLLYKVVPTLSPRMNAPPPPGPGAQAKVEWADYPGLMQVQSRMFEQLVHDRLAGGSSASSLALHIKKAEMATGDLIALVRLSDLRSKDTLAETLTEFMLDAKIAERSLHRLNAKVNGVVDGIMAMNDFALNAIDSARDNEPGSLGELRIWKSSKKTIDDVVKETFSEAMHVMSTYLERLIVEHEANSANLDRLEEKLLTVQDIIVRENNTFTEGKQELLADLWTELGGNRKDLWNFDRNLKMLRDLATYRKNAAAHIAAALHILQTVNQDLEDMRERVAATNLAGSTIKPEVHMNSIKQGLERLREGKARVREIEEAALRKALAIDENGFELEW